MANFTKEQQVEIAEFFEHLVDADIDFDLDYTQAQNAVELGKLIRRESDDYEDIFERMEEYSDIMNNIVSAYWANRLEAVK